MMRFVPRRFRRFSKAEEGTATIQFTLLFLPMLMMHVMGAEPGVSHAHYAMLERAVATTLRE